MIVISLIYSQTQIILKERLQERIKAIVSTAALQFNAEEIESIIKDSAKLSEKLTDLINPSYEKFNTQEVRLKIMSDSSLKNHPIFLVTEKMKAIREQNLNLKYIYLLSPTDTPNLSKFVTDSDTVIPVDWDGNGMIDEIEVPPAPGEDYDITEIPAVSSATSGPAVMADLYTDKWGSFLSGYAPIKNQQGKSVAVLGIDVQVDDFNKIIRATLLPFIFMAVLLLMLLSLQTITVMRIWRNRVNIVKELDRQKDELLSMVSHQLATPITSTKWYIEMLVGGDLGKLTDEQTKHVTMMGKIASNLSELVGMILDVSRIQLGKVRIEKQKLELEDFFKEIFDVIDPQAKEKEIYLNKEIPKKLPTANLDKKYTRMTIENLLTNAIKYTPKKGKVNFRIKIEDNFMICEIEDTGCGIPLNDQEKIFGKLYRASNVRNAVEGNGFGLYVAKGAVEAQGGKISFTSKENQGTKFTVKLPL